MFVLQTFCNIKLQNLWKYIYRSSMWLEMRTSFSVCKVSVHSFLSVGNTVTLASGHSVWHTKHTLHLYQVQCVFTAITQIITIEHASSKVPSTFKGCIKIECIGWKRILLPLSIYLLSVILKTEYIIMLIWLIIL